MTPRLGVTLSGHWLTLEEVLSLVTLADRLGYAVALVDGDATVVPGRPSAHIYDGTALVATALARTERIRIGAIQLPGFAPPAIVARRLSTLQLASGGRALGFFGVGEGRYLDRIGLPAERASARIDRLAETLDAVRELSLGGPVSRKGAYVHLEDVTAPVAPSRAPLVVAAARPRALELVAEYADVWDANVPPVARRIDPLREAIGREIETWCWVFARPDAELDEAFRAYRELCPWFDPLDPSERETALLYGDPRGWPERVGELAGRLAIDLPILDLMGLDCARAERAIRAAAPANPERMP